MRPLEHIGEIIRALQQAFPQRDMLHGSSIPLDARHFHPLPSMMPDLPLTFIDGGNQEILGAPHFSLQFIRIVALTYAGTRKIRSTIHECFVLITAVPSQESFQYHALPFGSTLVPELFFRDEDIPQQEERTKARVVGGMVRRIAELRAALQKSGERCILVLDGALEARHPVEQELLTQLQQQDVTLCGLSKTTTLLTASGNTLTAALASRAPEGSAWYYYPLEQGKPLYMLKLHPASRHLFSVHICGDVSGALAALRAHAQDPSFLGYPYGLIQADAHARVQNSEHEYLRLACLARLHELPALHALDAHDILDTLS
ncbi:hypothetical protein HY491_00635 [Candidatus Woesearchaeota archaeon]|nr:hypothetical protein [Candidatus Woesearchaeota archaeon]